MNNSTHLVLKFTIIQQSSSCRENSEKLTTGNPDMEINKKKNNQKAVFEGIRVIFRNFVCFENCLHRVAFDSIGFVSSQTVEFFEF